MENYDVYKDIAERTQGDIYIGVVGPVRTGKSTFISRFVQTVVMPKLSDDNKKSIAIDELPQSSDGKTVMTTEPKFVPAEAVSVDLGDNGIAKVRLIDCVGYMVEGAKGADEDGKTRMVKTPWSPDEMPFEDAAQLGTDKVIRQHSTIGIVVTTDGSISGIDRNAYEKAEEKAIAAIEQTGKPYIIILNSTHPSDGETTALKQKMELKYNRKVIAVDVLNADENALAGIIGEVLFEFEVKRIDVTLPEWMMALPPASPIVSSVLDCVKKGAASVCKMKDYEKFSHAFDELSSVNPPDGAVINLGDGTVKYSLTADNALFYEVVSDETGEKIENEYDLLSYVRRATEANLCYKKIKDALNSAEESGYGVVEPSFDDIVLSEPNIVRTGNRYTVKIKASSTSLHIMTVDVKADVSLLTGNEKQCNDFVDYLKSESGDDVGLMMKTNMFGRSLSSLVEEEIAMRTGAMPDVVRNKMKRIATKVVNDRKNNIICIIS